MRYHELIETMVRTPRDDFQTDLTSHDSILENPTFRSWFGKSKVVDPNGLPLVCYHGTFQEFAEFKHKSERVKSHGFDISFKKKLIANGYDGIHLEGTTADWGSRGHQATDWYIAFSANQIKSIWGSNFTDSPHLGESEES